MSSTPKTTAADTPQRPPLPLVLRELGLTPERVRRAASHSRLRYAIGLPEQAKAKAQATTATT